MKKIPKWDHRILSLDSSRLKIAIASFVGGLYRYGADVMFAAKFYIVFKNNRNFTVPMFYLFQVVLLKGQVYIVEIKLLR